MPNAGDQRSVKKAEKRGKFLRRRELDDLKTVMATVPGRRFVWGLLTKASVFHASFHAENARVTDFNEGRRSFGLELMAEIHALDPGLYIQMAKEAQMTEAVDQMTDDQPDAPDIYAPDTHVVIPRQPEEDFTDA